MTPVGVNLDVVLGALGCVAPMGVHGKVEGTEERTGILAGLLVEGGGPQLSPHLAADRVAHRAGGRRAP